MCGTLIGEKTGNKKLHTWAFDRIYQYLAYKGEEHGVEVLKENEGTPQRPVVTVGILPTVTVLSVACMSVHPVDWSATPIVTEPKT